MEEIWKDIPGYEGRYQVSDVGRVKSLNYKKTNKERIMKLNLTGKGYKKGKGYYSVQLSKNGVRYEHPVHRLVLLAFRGDSELTVNHINHNTTDNRLCNLEYMTNADNVRYSQGKPINQYTLDGKLITEWETVNDAIRATGITHICDCCKGFRKSAGGYKWQYK